MSEIVEFLRGRIAEDERRAPRKHGDFYEKPCPKCGEPVAGIGSPIDDEAARAMHERGGLGCQLTREQAAVLMPDLGPSVEGIRVLARASALLQVVELHSPDAECCVWSHSSPETHAEAGELACPTLQALATAYADHSDYRQEWKP